MNRMSKKDRLAPLTTDKSVVCGGEGGPWHGSGAKEALAGKAQ